MNYALQAVQTTDSVTYTGEPLSNVVVEMLIQTSAGFELTVRQNAAGQNQLRLFPDGQISLYRNGLLLAETHIAPAPVQQWRHIRLSAMGYTFRVAVDGIEVLVTTDPLNLLMIGSVSFRPLALSQNPMLVDNIRFWIPQAQVTSVPVAPLALPTGISLIEQSEYFWDWTPAVSDLGWTITGGSLVTGLGIRAAWNTFQNQMYGARIELTLDQTVSVDRIVMNFSQLQSFDRITMQLLDANGSIVRSMSANYPTLQEKTFDEVSPWQQVRTIRLSWQTGNDNSHLSTVRLIPDGVLEPSPTPPPTSTMTPTETPSPTNTPTPTDTPTPAFNVIVVDDTGSSNPQSLQSFDVGSQNVDSRLADNGICSLTEAIEKANYLSDPENAGPDPTTDCTPSKSDETQLENTVVVEAPAIPHVISDPEYLPAITGRVVIRSLSAPATITRWEMATANFRLFTIQEGGSLTLENIIVSNGYAPTSDNNGNGGGILNAGTLTLINSAVIDNYAEGSGGGIYNTGTATITGSCITGNTSLNGTSVHSTTPMTATNNWWGAVNGPAINGVGTGDLIAGNVTWNPHNSLPQTGNGIPCNTNRDVAPEAQAFHDNWRAFGLPMPFEIFPYEDTNLRELSVQGFGPNTFAYEYWANNYKGTYAIHTGVDYARWRACEGGSNQWCQARIVSLCDGVVTRGRNASDGYGGSASPGYGISIRCFDNNGGSTSLNQPINLLDYDTDGDGNPNLSNIIVTYNHLGYCTRWENSECTGDRIDTRFSGYYTDIAGVGVVVRQGQFLGTTGYHPTFDHLHMEVYLARGYESARSAIVLNPFLMYSNSLWDLHAQQGQLIRAYYPVKLDFSNLDPISNVYESLSNVGEFGIFIGDLNMWSQGGNRARGDRNRPNTWFWRIQTVEPTTVVEWHSDLYPIPLAGVINDTFSTDLLTYVRNIYLGGMAYSDQYLLEFGMTPNCVLVPNTTPIRVQCPRADLTQDLPE